MATQNPTTYLGLSLPVNGQLSGTWGDTVNNSVTSLLDSAVAGTTTLSTDADVPLSSTNYVANQARQAILLCTGARTALRTITAPNQSKVYVVINSTTGGYSVKLVGTGPTSPGVTILSGEYAVCAWDGSDFVKVSSNTITAFIGVLAAANGGTGQSSYTIGDLLYASGATTLSKLADIATGNALISGGAGAAPSYGKIGLTTHISGTLPIANGGTNTTATPTNGGITYGTGTALAYSAAGTANQILTSSGAGAPTWITTVPTANGGTNTTTSPTNGGVVYGTATAMAYSAAGTSGQVLISAGAAAPTWSAFTGTGSVVKDTSPTLVTPLLGTPTSGNLANCTFPTLNQNTTGTAAGLSATLVIGSGGTNGTASPTAGAVSYGTGSAYAFSAAGTSGQVLISGGSGSPTWAAVTGTGSVVKATSPTIATATLTGANTIQGLTVGLGAGALDNTAFGSSALAANTGGTLNTAIGNSALLSNTDGVQNVAVGHESLKLNIDGGSNTAVGYLSLKSNTSGTYNTALGNNTLSSNTSGSENTALGQAALSSITNGTQNVAVGVSSIQNNVSGVNNTSVGYFALGSGTSGSYNSMFGHIAGQFATGNNNVGIGYRVFNNLSTGSANIAIGVNNLAGTYAPVFDPVAQNNRICMGHTGVTNAYIQVAWTVVSDARDKIDFATVPHGLDFVTKLQPTAYRYKETRDSTVGHGPLRYGFKAQDVLELEGSNSVIVDSSNPNKLFFNDQSMIAVLVNAIKELKNEFDEYKAAHP
jgi:hypothetical protein